MGVLEDAIREHLELKRAHGAPDDEVEREETEALGQARQPAPAEAEDVEAEDVEAAPEEGAELLDEHAAPAGESLAVAEAPELSQVDDAPADFAGDFETAAPEPEAIPEPEPVAEPELEEISFDEEEPGVAPPMPKPARPQEEPAPEAAEGDSEDLLEDTPDFLQDTPEHDRLWFEQKPPRDFDFD